MSYPDSNSIGEPYACHQCGAIQPGNGKASPLGRALTARQFQVAALVAEGKHNYSIAKKLGITEHTVKIHMQAIFGKLGVRKRQEVANRIPQRASLVP